LLDASDISACGSGASGKPSVAHPRVVPIPTDPYFLVQIPSNHRE
jgi:hypothetical protein